jgi:hypothetical protein
VPYTASVLFLNLCPGCPTAEYFHGHVRLGVCLRVAGTSGVILYENFECSYFCCRERTLVVTHIAFKWSIVMACRKIKPQGCASVFISFKSKRKTYLSLRDRTQLLFFYNSNLFTDDAINVLA